MYKKENFGFIQYAGDNFSGKDSVMNTVSDMVRDALQKGDVRAASKACFPMFCGFTASEEWKKCVNMIKSVPWVEDDVYFYVIMVLEALREGNLKEEAKWMEKLTSLKELFKDNTAEKELAETAVSWLNVRIPRSENSSLMMELSALYNSEMEESVRFGHLCPTAGSPGILRGAKDISDWGRKYKAMGNIIKPMLPSLFEDGGKGVWELFLAELFYEKNQLYLSEENVESAVEAENIPIKFAALCQYSRILRINGESYISEKLMDEASELISDFPDMRMHRNLAAIRVRCNIEKGNLDSAKNYASENSEETGSYCADKMFRLITLGKAYIALGRYRDAIRFFGRLIELAENDVRPLDTAECYANCAVAHKLSGNNSMAEEKINKALKIARPYGYVRLFADMGEVIADILKNIAAEDDSYVQEIIKESENFSKSFPQLYKFVRNNENMVAGSVRMTGTEQAVLLLLNRGLTNKEISECMNIKITTVKFHVKNILGKLGAVNRIEAVSFAKKIRLID